MEIRELRKSKLRRFYLHKYGMVINDHKYQA